MKLTFCDPERSEIAVFRHSAQSRDPEFPIRLLKSPNACFAVEERPFQGRVSRLKSNEGFSPGGCPFPQNTTFQRSAKACSPVPKHAPPAPMPRA